MKLPTWHRIVWPAAALALLFALGTSWALWHARTGLRSEPASARSVIQASAPLVIEKPPPAKQDFAQTLPDQPATDAMVSMLQRSSAAQGVVFVSVAANTKAASASNLGRVEMSVALRGSYPQIKAVIAAVVQNTPALVIHRLTLRRLASPAEVDAQLEFWLLSPPMDSPASGRRP